MRGESSTSYPNCRPSSSAFRLMSFLTLAPQATSAAKHATQTIPIVFVAMGDPVASGIVPSLARPGANLTGTTRMISDVSTKHAELLKEAVPSLAKLAVL
jgi:putative ABC transport system substrate-binding protein